MTTSILENLRLAHSVIAEIPETAIDLFRFRSSCGTLSCIAGHLCDNPHFAQFMALKKVDSSYQLYSRLPDGSTVPVMCGFNKLDQHFGPDAYEKVFDGRNAGGLDSEHPEADKYGDLPPSVTNKALSLWRIERQIEAVTALQEIKSQTS